MKVKGVILKSIDKELLGQFLSELFECDLNHEGDCITLITDAGLRLMIIDQLEVIKDSSTIVDFQLDSVDELHDFIQKIKFVMYRHNISDITVSDIYSSEGTEFFEFTDFDHRTWRISC